MDELASTGVVLDKAYAYSTCTPSRAALVTGYFAEKSGMNADVLTMSLPYGLPTKFKLMPEYFQDYGYDTYAIGKWNLGYCHTDYTPCKRGFDSFYGYYAASEDYYTHQTGGWLDFTYQNSTTTKAITDQNKTHSMVSFTNQALSVLESQDTSKNFFMYFAVQNPHDTLAVPDEFYNLYPSIVNEDRRKYLGLVSQLDDSIGQIIAKLKSLGLYDNTIIAFTSDNGGSVSSGGSNYPLRGSKDTMYEGGNRVRAFINSPDLTADVNEGLFHIVDWVPTLLDAAITTSVVSLTGLDGINHWPQISTQTATTRSQFIYNINPYGLGGTPYIETQAVRYGDYKLISGCPGLLSDIYQQTNKVANPRTTQDYTYCNTASNASSTRTGATLLFNLADDPYESTNLATTNTAKLAELKAILTAYLAVTVTPLYGPSTASQPKKSDPSKFGGVWSAGWCTAA
jgi:arylsulfatase I/J